jgi:hypothetical protein
MRLPRLIIGLVKKEIQLVGSGIGIQLPVPDGLVALPEPVRDPFELVGRQVVDRSFDFLDPVHTCSLSQRGRPAC